MSSVTTDDMNEVIAIFDGWELVEREVEMSDFTSQKIMCFTKEGNRRYHHDLKYHASWDWLIPVIKKIKDHKQSCIRLPLNGISESVYPYVEAMQPMNRALIKADLKGVYDGVIKFIAWYNQNKNK